jgi:hypothetical protein
VERVPVGLEHDVLDGDQPVRPVRSWLVDEHLGVEGVYRRVEDLGDVGEVLSHRRPEPFVVRALVEQPVALGQGRDIVVPLGRLADAGERIRSADERNGHAEGEDRQSDGRGQESSPAHHATSTVSS